MGLLKTDCLKSAGSLSKPNYTCSAVKTMLKSPRVDWEIGEGEV